MMLNQLEYNGGLAAKSPTAESLVLAGIDEKRWENLMLSGLHIFKISPKNWATARRVIRSQISKQLEESMQQFREEVIRDAAASGQLELATDAAYRSMASLQSRWCVVLAAGRGSRAK